MLSPDGTQIVYAKANSDGSGVSDIWSFDVVRGASTRLTFGGSVNGFPIWSPDGSEIVFASNREGRFNMYRKRPNGAKDEELLLQTNENTHPESWSRDGKYLIYASSQNAFNANDLWVLPMRGDRTPFPIARTRFNETTAEFSPDGRWIAYASNESGDFELYVREFISPPGPTEAGAKWLVSNGSGIFPLWRADGKELSYHNLLKDSRMSVSIDSSRTFHAGVPRELFQEPVGTIREAATADLKRYLLVVPAKQEGPQSFTVVVNWEAGLKK
jgi:Tol biopolymer transport system component